MLGITYYTQYLSHSPCMHKRKILAVLLLTNLLPLFSMMLLLNIGTVIFYRIV
jgi:hypothetical protein